MRHYKCSQTVDSVINTCALLAVGLSEMQADEMYRYLTIANYEDHFRHPQQPS